MDEPEPITVRIPFHAAVEFVDAVGTYSELVEQAIGWENGKRPESVGDVWRAVLAALPAEWCTPEFEELLDAAQRSRRDSDNAQS